MEEVKTLISIITNNSLESGNELIIISLKKLCRLCEKIDIFQFHSTLLSDVANCIIRSKLLAVKEYGMRFLFVLSMNHNYDQYFFIDKSWINLSELIFRWNSCTCIFYYQILISNMMIGSNRSLLSTHHLELMKQILLENKSSLILYLETLIRDYSYDFLHMSVLDNRVLCLLSEIASRGHIISGILVNIIVYALAKSQWKHNAEKLLLSGGIQSILRINVSNSLHDQVKEETEKNILILMETSSYVRKFILESYSYLARSMIVIGHPENLLDPRQIYMSQNDESVEKEKEYYISQDINISADGNALELPILRDIEWLPRNGTSWRLSSAILWSSCPGIRSIINNFWDNESGGGMVLKIDVSWETLNCICLFIHSGIFVNPPLLYQNLELAKASIELENIELHNKAIDYLKNIISLHNINEIYQFSHEFNIGSLKQYCKYFQDADYHGIESNNDLNDFQYCDSDTIEASVTESLNAVSKILENNSSNLRKDNYAFEEISMKNDNHVVDKNSQSVNLLQPRRKLKSGGIYGIILDNMIPEDKPMLPTNKSTATKTISNNKKNYSKQQSFQAGETSNIIEFDNSMSLVPNKPISEKEKRLFKLSQSKAHNINDESKFSSPLKNVNNNSLFRYTEGNKFEYIYKVIEFIVFL